MASVAEGRRFAGFRFHDLRHTVVTDLLEAGEPEHVIEAITGHLSRRMLEHYSHQRLKAKGQMLTRMENRRKSSHDIRRSYTISSEPVVSSLQLAEYKRDPARARKERWRVR